MKKEFIAFFKSMWPDKTKEIDALEASLKEPEPPKPIPPTPEPLKPNPAIPADVQAVVDGIKKQNETLAEQLKQLQEQTKSTTEAQKKEKVDAAIAKAIADKKIPAKNDAKIKTYRTLLENDFDGAQQAIADLPVIGEATHGNQSVPVQGSESKNYFTNPKPFLDAAKDAFKSSAEK
jgi:hypothetical protein